MGTSRRKCRIRIAQGWRRGIGRKSRLLLDFECMSECGVRRERKRDANLSHRRSEHGSYDSTKGVHSYPPVGNLVYVSGFPRMGGQGLLFRGASEWVRNRTYVWRNNGGGGLESCFITSHKCLHLAWAKNGDITSFTEWSGRLEQGRYEHLDLPRWSHLGKQ